MRVAVVGPTGVLGRELVPLLFQKGYTILALARSSGKARRLFPQLTEILECDLLSIKTGQLSSLLEGCDTVVHIATSIPSDPGAPGAWVANSRLRTQGVRTLLDASLQAGVGRYIQQSITMAYPDHGEDWITEDMPLDSSPERAQVCAPVIAMEQMLRETAVEKLSWCILRGGAFVGKDTFQEKTIAGLRLGEVVVPCNGRNFASFIHTSDMAAAIVAAIENPSAGSIFNVVDEPVRSGEYLDRLADIIGAPRPGRDRMAECPPSWRCSNQAAKEVLGWQPLHGIIPSL